MIVRNAFMISPFNKTHNKMYSEYIKKEMEKIHINIVRADENPQSGLVFDKIKTMVSGADLIIADISEHNPNVMLEIGIAVALNKNVIYIIDERYKDKVPTDIRAYEWWPYTATQTGGRPDWWFTKVSERTSLSEMINSKDKLLTNKYNFKI